MPIATGLTNEEALAIAGSVLKTQIGQDGLGHVEVRSGDDHDGEDALLVTAAIEAGRDIIPGDTFSRVRSARCWHTVTTLYRAVDHGAAKRQFERYGRDTVASADPKQIAREFVALQAARIRADYDPAPTFTRMSARQYIADAESAVRKRRDLPPTAKRELVVQVTAKTALTGSELMT